MILIITMIQSLKELPSNLNMVCSSRIFKLGLLTILINIFSNMKTLSFFLYISKGYGNEMISKNPT